MSSVELRNDEWFGLVVLGTCVLWSTGMMNGLDWRYMCFVEHRNEEWLGLGGTWVLPSAWIMNGLDCVLHEFCRVHEWGMVWTVFYTSSAECTNVEWFGLCATRVLPSARMRNCLDCVLHEFCRVHQWGMVWTVCYTSSAEWTNEEWFGLVVHVFCGAQEWGMVLGCSHQLHFLKGAGFFSLIIFVQLTPSGSFCQNSLTILFSNTAKLS